MNDKILISNLVVAARIGIFEEEKNTPQRIRIHCIIELAPQTRSGKDDITDTIRYDTVRQNIIHLLTGQHTELLETAAENIAKLCLADKRAAAATIRIEKLDVFPDCQVGVEITRRQTI
ncbi:MAG: dihydroneopterin aldolase [Alphaproteobacteria bacterium]|nr:MAG: dihydroneopterin aldolase [Alphaproteobacteria bacterium]